MVVFPRIRIQSRLLPHARGGRFVVAKLIVPLTRILLILLVGASLSSSSDRHRRLPQEAYIWQRQWTPALEAAVAQSSDLIEAWRVLAAEADERGELRPAAIDWEALRQSGRPVVAVFRIDGQLSPWEDDALLGDLRRMLVAMEHAPIAIVGIEIDHDCATARLPAYARFLAKLRAGLDGTKRLSITALPTWLASEDLDAVLASVDETVLQVHAVENPHAGLFNATRAMAWVRSLAGRTARPFRVALPAYGSRVSWRGDGGWLAVESEAPVLAGGRSTSELIALPQDVSGFLRRLEREGPEQLAGVAWFRLPTAQDRRAWSLATWRAVIRGEPLRPEIAVARQDTGQSGVTNLVLMNVGEIDAQVPYRVVIPSACPLADGVNGYALIHSGSAIAFQRVGDRLLHRHQQEVIGWVRCSGPAEEFHVQP